MSAGQTRMVEVKTGMLMHHPFFASLLLDIMKVKVGKFPEIFGPMGKEGTAATDGHTIYFDEDFLAELPLLEAVFVTCHEIGHAMFMHMPRAKMFADCGFEGEKFQHQVWNIAGDYVINAMLVESRAGTMPTGKYKGLLDKKYTSNMMVDDVYRDLMKDPQMKKAIKDAQDQQDALSDALSKLFGPGAGEGRIDQHINDAQPKITEAEMKRAVTTAVEAAKAMGKLPLSLKRFADALMESKVSWKDELRTDIIRAAARDTTTWKSPHRRRLVTNRCYMPSYTGYALGEIVVAFDTSGSIGQQELNAGMSELAEIFATCRPEKVTCMSCDAAVHTVVELEEGRDLLNDPPELEGGGGTAFEPVFDKVAELGLEPQVLIYFTDMYGSFPKDPPPYDVIWLSSSPNTTGPFGRTIFIDVTQR